MRLILARYNAGGDPDFRPRIKWSGSDFHLPLLWRFVLVIRMYPGSHGISLFGWRSKRPDRPRREAG